MSNRQKRKRNQKKAIKKEVINSRLPNLPFHAKRTWGVISAIGVVVSLILAYLAVTASVTISPVIELSSRNQFALPFRVKNSNILPVREIQAEMVIKYVEDDHQNRFYNDREYVSIRDSLASGDYVDHVFESISTDTKIVKGEVEVIISYKLPLLPKEYADKKTFYARQQPDGTVRWLAR